VKKGTPKETAPAGKPAPDRPFDQGIEARRVTPRAIEGRLCELLRPLVEGRSGIVSTLEEAGESGLFGLALTFANDQSFDLVIREARK
jgi:hypothetical protein